MPVTINGSTGITTPTSNIGTATVSNTITTSALSVTGNIIGDVSTTGTIAMASSFKRNRIINGNMLIDQRYAGSANTPSDGAYVVDRWQYSLSASGKFTTQQNAGSLTPPAGFTKYLGLTSNGSYSVGSTDGFGVKQRVEGYNVADLAWGTANAKTVTLSFWVYSSSTGTFGGTLFNASANRFYIYSYTINSTATWEYKTVTIPGDTTGTWNATNDVGIEVYFSIGAGSGRATTPGSWGSTLYVAPTGQTSIVGAGTGAYWYITGVQLEVGTKATPYEMQIYSDQLAQCQRYYYKQDTIITWFFPINNINVYKACNYIFPVTMRAAPTCVISGAATDGSFQSSFPAVGSTTKNQAQLRGDTTSSSNYSSFTDFTASAEL